MSSCRLLIDENMHRRITVRLRGLGHEVWHIGELSPGISDLEVAELARRRDAIMLTHDLDFGELVYRGGVRHCGVLLLRLGPMSFDDQAALLEATLRDHGDELVSRFSVLTPTKLRIRRG